MAYTFQAFGDNNLWNLPIDDPLTPQDVVIKPTSTTTRGYAIIPKYNAEATVEGDFALREPLADGTSVSGTMYARYIYHASTLAQVEKWSEGADVGNYSYVYELSLLGGNDVFEGSATAANRDFVQGLGGNDTFKGYGDDSYGDFFYGGAGTDTAMFRGKLADYKIQAVSDIWDYRTDVEPRVSGLRVTDLTSNRDGIDSLNEVERLKFSDKNLAFDTGKGENAGMAYRLYKAAFDRTPDSPGLGYWVDSFDRGVSLEKVASSFIGSSEFKSLYGANTSDATFVGLLYQHVLHRDLDAAGNAYWLAELASGVSRGAILASFSEAKENIDQTAKLVANGIQYMEYL